MERILTKDLNFVCLQDSTELKTNQIESDTFNRKPLNTGITLAKCKLKINKYTYTYFVELTANNVWLEKTPRLLKHKPKMVFNIFNSDEN